MSFDAQDLSRLSHLESLGPAPGPNAAVAPAAGDKAQATALARQSRGALQQPAALSPYFKQPLERLEGALGPALPATIARR